MAGPDAPLAWRWSGHLEEQGLSRRRLEYVWRPAPQILDKSRWHVKDAGEIFQSSLDTFHRSLARVPPSPMKAAWDFALHNFQCLS